MFLSIEKAEEFNQRINFLSDEKSILEDEFFQMRTRFRQNQLHMDEAKAKAENYQELLESLQKAKQSDLSDRLIQMSERLQSMKLGEMRATRELKEVKEDRAMAMAVALQLQDLLVLLNLPSTSSYRRELLELLDRKVLKEAEDH